MRAADFISTRLKPLSFGMSINEAIAQMNQFGVNNLPLVEGGKVAGIINVNEISLAPSNDLLSSYIDNRHIHRIIEEVHEFDILRFFHGNSYDTLAIVNLKDEFSGIICLGDVVEEIQNRMNRLAPFNEPGGILVLEMKRVDLHLSEIARIVESNDMKIIQLYVGQPYENSPLIEVNIRVDRPDIRALLGTFERFNYSVVFSTITSEDWDEMQQRFKSFIRYLNI